MKDKNVYLWVPYGSLRLDKAIKVSRSELEILKNIVRNEYQKLIINININNRKN